MSILPDTTNIIMHATLGEQIQAAADIEAAKSFYVGEARKATVRADTIEQLTHLNKQLQRPGEPIAHLNGARLLSAFIGDQGGLQGVKTIQEANMASPRITVVVDTLNNRVLNMAADNAFTPELIESPLELSLYETGTVLDDPEAITAVPRSAILIGSTAIEACFKLLDAKYEK